MPVYEIEKNSQERIRFEVTEYKGHTLVDMRVYRGAGEEWKPTPKGLAINPVLWPEFVKGIEALGVELQEQGLVPDPEDPEEGGSLGKDVL